MEISEVGSKSENEALSNGEIFLRVTMVFILLFFFLVGVKSLEGSFSLLGDGFANGLLNISANPFMALLSGILATAIIQSSSVTTSIVVGLVSSGAVSLDGAIPMIMGANIGTSITNTLVSLGYLKDQKNFGKAFAAATIHDFFNILTVVVLLPLQLATGFLSKASESLASVLFGTSTGFSYSSPLKDALAPFTKLIKSFVLSFGFSDFTNGVLLVIFSGAIIVLTLGFIVKMTKVLVESNSTDIIEKLLSKNGYLTILAGTIMTIAVQSSSITTSLLVPLAASGIIRLETVYPFTIGANIGTTTTALIAAMAGNIHGLAIALSHLLFNICGMLLWYVHPTLRKIPILCCETLANLTKKNRIAGIMYVLCVFLIFPAFFIYLF